MSSPDVKNDAAPKWGNNSQRAFLMGRAIHALTGRAARHENTEIYFLGQHFPKKSLSGVFCYQKLLVDFGVWFPWWIFLGEFFLDFLSHFPG